MAGLLEEQIQSSSPDQERGTSSTAASGAEGLPKGVVLGKDGKPCRTCTSSSAWLSLMKSSTKSPKATNTTSTTTTTAAATAAAATAVATPDPSPSEVSSLSPHHTECPPDVEELGHSSWTLLHSLTATYPPNPSPSMQSTTKQFISLFSQLYPCWVCADDFRAWMARPENDVGPQLASQEKFGRWMCRAHNEVNRKLGKREFDCDLWRQRWQDGWDDGRCG